MLHPGKEIMMRLEALNITQKTFSSYIGKRVSEINELIKGKRNITIAREFILSDFFKTPPKYRIYKQVDYDYEQMLTELKMKDQFYAQKPVAIDNEKQENELDVLERDKNSTKEKNENEMLQNKVSWGDNGGELMKNQNNEKKELHTIQDKVSLSAQEDLFRDF